MEREDERKPLLSSDDKLNGDPSGQEQKKTMPEETYMDDDDAPLGETVLHSEMKCLQRLYETRCIQWLYRHRKRIPGYGMFQLLKKSGVYSLYVLFALLIAYLLNQLDRYTLPIVTEHVGADLRYGDFDCQANPHQNMTVYKMLGLNLTDYCHKL